MRTIDAMKKLARNDGRFTHVYTKKELSELFNETGSKLNGTLKSLIKENILNRAYHNVYVFRFSQYGGLGTLDLIGKKIRPNDSFYESLESSASAWSLISQIPTVVTYMTTGKSKWYNTVYGMGAMCIAMLANYIPRYRAKEITLKSRVPMGPFLLVWLCTGVPLGCIM